MNIPTPTIEEKARELATRFGVLISSGNYPNDEELFNAFVQMATFVRSQDAETIARLEAEKEEIGKLSKQDPKHLAHRIHVADALIELQKKQLHSLESRNSQLEAENKEVKLKHKALESRIAGGTKGSALVDMRGELTSVSLRPNAYKDMILTPEDFLVSVIIIKAEGSEHS